MHEMLKSVPFFTIISFLYSMDRGIKLTILKLLNSNMMQTNYPIILNKEWRVADHTENVRQLSKGFKVLCMHKKCCILDRANY
jgi:hypothetical protein